MEPARPDRPTEGAGEPPFLSADDIGEFRQGTPASRWALARYLVGRSIIESVGTSLLILALILLAAAAGLYWGLGWPASAVIVLVLTFMVLLLRAGMLGAMRKLTAVEALGAIEDRLRSLVADTRGDVLRELRRVGLPSHTLTLPLLGVRLVGRRRNETLSRLRGFDVDRAVPAARLDELHMMLRDAPGRDARPGAGGTFPS